ncbi:MAG: inositol monophosphatase family protein [Actinomycetota bacterium]
MGDHPEPFIVTDCAEPADLLEIALQAADVAVELITQQRPNHLATSTKSSPTDLVTEMDRRAEQLISDVILAARPQDLIRGEEGVAASGESATAPVTWWVDPIDGTTNYVYDHPGYAVSIAAEVDGVTVAGVVADPTHGRTYHARAGGGAWCDETRLSLAEPPDLADALVATGFAYIPERRRAQAEVLARIIDQIRDVRRMGAAALDLCSVAAGRVDAYFEAGLSQWDYAAGSLVAVEAGAVVCSLEGGAVRPGSVLCAHPALAAQLVDLLAEA